MCIVDIKTMKKTVPSDVTDIAISVIVPVYNAEQYLGQCLSYLQCQTIHEYEVILIDDGSTDNSGAICDEFVRTDTHFKVIHQPNGGVGHARQIGLENSQGKYVIHVDPDDWVEPNMLEEMYLFVKANDIDIVICDYYEHYPDGDHIVVLNTNSLDNEKLAKELLEQKIYGFCWNKLVRRECIKKYHISFPSLALCEDLYFNISLLMHPVKVGYLPKAFYHYNRTNPKSITLSGNPLSGIYAYEACLAFRSLLENNHHYWSRFIRGDMPYMAYLSLCFGGISAKQYQQAYHELRTYVPRNSKGRFTKYALSHFSKVRVIIIIIRKVVCIRKRLGI